MNKSYDAIVVGARCAGSPTAMLLARKGFRVLLVDRATFPSDVVSSHVVQPRGVAALARWGLLQRLVATGCPPIHTSFFDFGALTISGSPGTKESPVAYCPRRTVLDKILVDAAAEAGAEVREGFSVKEVLSEEGGVVGVRGVSGSGETFTERAKVVVGADGWHSTIAAAVRPEQYNSEPPLLAGYYSYWSGLPDEGRLAIYIRSRRAFGMVRTHDDLTLIIGGWPVSEFAENKHDVEGHFMAMLDLVPDVADRMRLAKREARFAGAVLPNYFRKPYGPGWVLVGDAGYIKDSITAQGITDAFLDAERCSAALEETLTGTCAFDDAMQAYQRARDEDALPMYRLTLQVAALDPPTPQMQQLLGAVSRSQSAMDSFARMNAGSISPAEFMSPENIGAIMSGAAAMS
jgi:2-polyprenyl-6-methoxyphenol hydroxylase-like FAD-dependent oxidoreductase